MNCYRITPPAGDSWTVPSIDDAYDEIERLAEAADMARFEIMATTALGFCDAKRCGGHEMARVGYEDGVIWVDGKRTEAGIARLISTGI